MSDVNFTSHKDEIEAELNRRIPIILNAVGLEAEGIATRNVNDMKAVDTGRLKNSITHALSGKAPDKLTYTDDENNVYAYPAGTAPADSDDEPSVYIGTNVEYAPYIELGTYRMASRPFLRKALSDHTDHYKKLMQDGLK